MITLTLQEGEAKVELTFEDIGSGYMSMTTDMKLEETEASDLFKMIALQLFLFVKEAEKMQVFPRSKFMA